MVNFTDMSGLASSAIAITAITFQLPGVARLQRMQFAMLIFLVAVTVLIPIADLSLAAYVRGWMGDLSITSLLLLLMAILHRLNGKTPSGKLNAPSPSKGDGWGEGSRQTLLILIVVAALGLYPMALGIGYFDPYRLGYGNLWFIGGLLLMALATWFRQRPLASLAIAMAVFAWGLGWYESNNLWDYLLDPLLAIYAFYVLVKQGMQLLLTALKS